MQDDRRLIDRLWAEGWRPSPWSNAPGERYRSHVHDYDKVIVVSAGSIRFGLPEATQVIDLAEREVVLRHVLRSH